MEVGSKEEKPNETNYTREACEPSKPSKPENNLRILTDRSYQGSVVAVYSSQVVALKVKKVAAQSLEGKLYDA